MESWIFTFGFDHHHPETGEPLRNHYIEIRAPTEAQARQAMFDTFGAKWSMEYTTKDEAGVDRFGLRPLPPMEVA